VKTGIAELDEMLGGGFLEGDSVMVAGSAGTGKTVFALQHIVNGVTQFDENGIYVTFEQMPDQIYRDSEHFGWNLKEMEKENKLRLICTSPKLLLETEGEHVLDQPIREIAPQRIVIDSLGHFTLQVSGGELRREIYRLVRYLKSKGLSSLLTGELPQILEQSFSAMDFGLSFLVDCIILLRFVEIESQIKKALVILKMRGSDHDKRLREFEITPKGISLTGLFTEYEGVLGGAPRKSLTSEVMDSWVRAFSERAFSKGSSASTVKH
jgi:circadian clock protein KaiC